MTRIPRLHHNNFKQRTPNYSYMEADALYVSGQSISSTVLYGPPIAVHSSRCPTVTQEKPVVDTKSLKINNEARRPFFEDQYSWVKGPYEASGYHLAKYYGSGNLADDEVRAYVSGIRGAGKIVFQDSSLSGHYYSQVTNWESDYKSWITQYEKDTFGIEDNIVGNNIIMTAGIFGHLVDRWVCKVRDTDEDYESVVVVNDGRGFGRQNYGDGQYLETFGNLQDERNIYWQFLTSNKKPPNGYDGIPSYDGYPLFSGIRFTPPLPKSYLNPITVPGVSNYYEFNSQPSGNIMFPEKYFESQHVNANVIYSKRTPEANKLTIESAYVPSDFGAELRGGDTVSASPFGFIYWNQYENEVVNPTSGFIETSLNALERGYIPGTSVQQQAYLRYRKTIVNFGGEGVHREVFGVYKNHDFDYKNYLGSKAFDRVSGSAIPESVGNAYINYFGELTRGPEASNEYQMSEIIGAGLDNRFNEMHLYSPETKKSLTFSQVSAATVKIGGVTTALETPRYFKAIPDIAAPGNVTNTFMSMSFMDDSSTSAINDLNNITLTSQEGSATSNPYEPVDAVYFKSFSPSDPEWLGSNQLFVIQERTEDNPGGLSTAAIGHFGILNSGQSSNVTKSGWLAPGIGKMQIGPGTVSGILGTENYGNAFYYLWTSSTWGTGPRGDNYQDRLSMPAGIMQFTNGGTSYSPKGWQLMHELVIVGTSKDDVISKLHTFLDNNTWNKFIYPEDELPDVVLNYQSPLKAGRIH